MQRREFLKIAGLATVAPTALLTKSQVPVIDLTDVEVEYFRQKLFQALRESQFGTHPLDTIEVRVPRLSTKNKIEKFARERGIRRIVYATYQRA